MILAQLLDETLAQWHTAERLLRDLEPNSNDHLAVRRQADLMFALYGKLTNGRERSDRLLTAERDAVEHARRVLGDVRSRKKPRPT